MPKREMLQQAQTYKNTKSVLGWLVSEKFDGIRAFWDGGVSRGIPATEVPWANTAKDKKVRISTGLWSRYGKPIHAPDWWLDQLPAFPLDGELWVGRGMHQKTRSYTGKHRPSDPEWRKVHYQVFDSPTLEQIFQDFEINLTQFKISVPYHIIQNFIQAQEGELNHHYRNTFSGVYKWMQENVTETKLLHIVEQTQIAHPSQIEAELDRVLSMSGEGLVYRNPLADYHPIRNKMVLKHKPYLDSEAVVVGYVTGRKTDLGSKLLGMMGAMIVDWNGKIFELSGFTNEERTLRSLEEPTLSLEDQIALATTWAKLYPETKCPENIEAVHFPRGTVVTFKYRELSDDGIPKEASYFRKRPVE